MLTPVQKHWNPAGPPPLGIFYKRDDMFCPYGDVNGGKVRQTRLLFSKYAYPPGGWRGVVAAVSVHSPTGPVISRVAKSYGIPCIIAVGGTTPENLDKLPMMKLSKYLGAEVRIVAGHGMKNAITARVNEICKETGYHNIDFSHHIYNDADLMFNTNGDQVENIPDVLDVLVMSVGVGIQFACVLKGLKKFNKKVKRIIGVQIGPDRRKLIDPKLMNPNMLGELLELEEQFDSTNVPVKILVTPAEIESYYRLKLKRLKEDIIGLNVIESLLDTAGHLNYFGYDYFYNFDQRELWERTIPPSDYILGPGDELIISVWGETERRERKTLDRDGTIFINDIGLIKIGELTLSKAENVIKKRFSRVYATMKGAKANTFIDVTHGKVSGKTINFTGRVKSPGYHVISPFIDPLTALIYAGGVDTTGSLRDILIMREGSQLDTIDFYKFFIEGQSYRKIFLRESDRIHIPNRASTVTIAGEVMHPGIYELRSTESLGDLLEFAGGMNPGANSLAHLSRLHHINGRIHLKNMYISNAELDTFKVNNGDIVTFYKMDYIPSYFHVYGIGSFTN